MSSEHITRQELDVSTELHYEAQRYIKLLYLLVESTHRMLPDKPYTDCTKYIGTFDKRAS